MTAIRVLIVDDEILVRSGLGLIVGSAPDLEVVGDCSGALAEEKVTQLRPHVVLLDIRMPDLDGISVLRRLRALPHPPAVAMLTTFDTDEYIGTALRAGAAGFMLKDTAPEQLVHAVRVLAAGGSVLSPTVTRTVISGYVDGGGPDAEAAALTRVLTGRELDVLALLGEGLSNAEIADRLFLGTGTVKDHISAILGKLGAANRVQAAVLANRAGLVRTPPEPGA
ncbi:MULTISPECIES: response regulator transcription factor [unclassified Kitasatospora]|uniref:response regulator n=1 Tax=unclassified Kitasatospora TaxID=2633591 RepID=UPI00071015A5|nr:MULTISPECIES: response regulator transcription factor [unclassified Kitasatospora]KQV22231.1 two-component system response regulator [Kitasatospora sp. Root107]KRB64628.1 two-component system response regulator [Kitasatospora sp. Root187]